MKVPLPPNESQRLKALHDYGILDTPSEREFDDITALAAEICETPIALISLVDETRQWFKSKVGLTTPETSREEAFCGHALTGNKLLQVPDAQLDQRFADNPLVTGDPKIRFYAGAPLVTPGGETLGTLCVIDRVPRQLTDRQQRALRVLSQHVMAQMQLRRQVRVQAQTTEERDRLFNLSLDMLSVAGFDGRLQQVNPAWTECLGWSTAELTSRLMLDYIHPEDHAATLRTREQITRGKQVRGFENRYRCKDGSYRWFSWNVHSLVESGQVFGVARDVTENKRTEEALRTSEMRLRTIVENEPECVKLVSVDGRLLEMNPAGLRMIEADEGGQVVGQPVIDLVHPEDREAFMGLHRRSGVGETGQLQFRVIGLKQTERWMETHSTPMRKTDGTISSVLSVTRDITERKRTEQALQASEERFRLLANATNDAIWDWDFTTSLRWWNEGYEKLFGHRHAEGSQSIRSWIDYVHPEDLPRVQGGVQHVIEHGGTDWTDEYRFRCHDGTYVYVRDRGHIIRDAAGQARRMIGGMTDLTESRRITEEVQQQAELIDQARDAILVRDLEHRVIFWSKGAERLYGWTAAESN